MGKLTTMTRGARVLLMLFTAVVSARPALAEPPAFHMRVPVTALVVESDQSSTNPSSPGQPPTTPPPTNPASANVSPSQLDFGNQLVGSASAGHSITVLNMGGEPLGLSGAGATGAFAIAGQGCSTELPAGASCTYSIVFSPTDRGVSTGLFALGTSAGQQTVSLKGSGVVSADAVSATQLTFENTSVGTSSAPQALTLSNSGDLPIGIQSITVSGAYTVTHNCPATLVAGAQCTANVTFNPTAAGPLSGVLNFVTDTGKSSVSLTGTGLQAFVAMTPNALVFSDASLGSSSQPQLITLKNSGNGDATLVSGTASGPFSIVATDCKQTLAPDESCTYQITFTPTAFGTQIGTLTAGSNTDQKTASLSGTAINYQVPLLAHMDGANGSASFVNAATGAALSHLSGTTISTQQSISNGASGYFNGNGAGVGMDGVAIGSNDFTFELWYLPLSTNRTSILFRGATSTSGVGLYLYQNGSTINLALNGGTTVAATAPTSLMTTGKWNHLAFERAGNTWKIFVNGKLGGSGTLSANIATPSLYGIGYNFNIPSFSAYGYMDEVRLTVGGARYTGDFVPPTGALTAN